MWPPLNSDSSPSEKARKALGFATSPRPSPPRTAALIHLLSSPSSSPSSEKAAQVSHLPRPHPSRVFLTLFLYSFRQSGGRDLEVCLSRGFPGSRRICSSGACGRRESSGRICSRTGQGLEVQRRSGPRVVEVEVEVVLRQRRPRVLRPLVLVVPVAAAVRRRRARHCQPISNPPHRQDGRSKKGRVVRRELLHVSLVFRQW
jgi:hypothetical protein